MKDAYDYGLHEIGSDEAEIANVLEGSMDSSKGSVTKILQALSTVCTGKASHVAEGGDEDLAELWDKVAEIIDKTVDDITDEAGDEPMISR